MAFEFSIATSLAGLDTPFPLEPKTRWEGPEQIGISLNDTPKFGGYQRLLLSWDFLEEAQWSALKVLSGNANRSLDVYVRAKAEDPETLTSTMEWHDFTCKAVAPRAEGQVGEKLRTGVTMELRKVVYVRDSVLTP